MPKRHYSDQERADALAVLKAHGNNYSKAARAAGIPRATIKLWSVDRKGVSDEDAKSRAAPLEMRQRSEKELTDRLKLARFQYLDHLMTEAVVLKESGYYSAQTFKILNEQHQLLTGGPTARIEGNLADFLRSHTGTTDKPAALPNVTHGASTDKAVALPN